MRPRMYEMTEADAAAAMERYRTFHFTLNAVVAGLGLEPTTEEYDRVWAVVNDVAAGEQTLTPSPAEVNLAGGTPALLAHVQRTLQEQMGRDRGIAESLVKAAEGIRVPHRGEPR